MDGAASFSHGRYPWAGRKGFPITTTLRPWLGLVVSGAQLLATKRKAEKKIILKGGRVLIKDLIWLYPSEWRLITMAFVGSACEPLKPPNYSSKPPRGKLNKDNTCRMPRLAPF